MDGILIVDKPKGYTSHDIVNIVRKSLNTKKVGHTGTLDPNATGVLPILIGTATKASKYLIEHDKEYIATLKLGKKTETADSEGKIIEEDIELKEKLRKLTNQSVEDIIKQFKGKQKQIPPKYSSIKINGKKAYEYARNGQTVNIEPRNIEIYEINLLKFEYDEILFNVKCSKGTYIRTLCEDIATKIGTVGYMKELRRTSINTYTLNDAITIDEIKNKSEKINKKIFGIEETFTNKEKIELDDRKKTLFLNGVQLTYFKSNDIYRIYSNNIFIGLGIVTNNLLKRDIVI